MKSLDPCTGYAGAMSASLPGVRHSRTTQDLVNRGFHKLGLFVSLLVCLVDTHVLANFNQTETIFSSGSVLGMWVVQRVTAGPHRGRSRFSLQPPDTYLQPSWSHLPARNLVSSNTYPSSVHLPVFRSHPATSYCDLAGGLLLIQCRRYLIRIAFPTPRNDTMPHSTIPKETR